MQIKHMYSLKISVAAILLFALAAMVSACDPGEDITLSIRKNKIEPMPFEDCFDLTWSVTLKEDTDELMRGISKVIVQKDEIYVSDGRAIFVFDTAGTFLRVIRWLGRGPGEYSYISDFVLGKDVVFVLDSNRKVLKYDKTGAFIADAPLDDFYSCMFLSDDNVYLVSANQKPGNRFHLLDAATLRETATFCSIPEPYLHYRHFMRMTPFFKTEEGLLYHEALDNTVYRIVDESLEPFVSFDFYGKSAPSTFWQKRFLDIADAFSQLRENGYCAGLPHFATNGSSFLYYYIAEDGPFMGLWSFSGKRQFQFDKIRFQDDTMVDIGSVGKFFYGSDDMYLTIQDDMGHNILMKVSLR